MQKVRDDLGLVKETFREQTFKILRTQTSNNNGQGSILVSNQIKLIMIIEKALRGRKLGI